MGSNILLNNKKNNMIKIISECNLENIKNNYILIRILNNLKKNKALKIIKHNKKIQKRININIADYKRYSIIEIEIKPIKYKFGVFINIPKKEDELYYHINFNDDKEEIKQYYISELDKVTKIKVSIDHEIICLKDVHL